MPNRRQKRQHRQISNVQVVRSDNDGRTVELSFSSETPIRNAGADEILSHDGEAVDLARLNSGAPLLFEHDTERQIGIVQRAWIDAETRRGRAIVRFGNSSFAKQVFKDVRDGIRQLVSVGFRILDAIEQGGRRIVRRWEPLELSIVTISADHTVGVGRSFNNAANRRKITMQTVENKELEKLRHEKKIREIATDHRERGYSVDEYVVTRAVNQGTDPNTFASSLWNSIPTAGRGADMDVLENMGRHERREFSLTRAIAGAISREGLHGYEAEVIEEHARATGQQPAAGGIVIPFSALRTQRSMLAGNYAAGGATVPVDVGGMIPRLDPVPVLERAGATVLRGLTAPTSFPRHTDAATAEWVAEAQEVAKSTPGTDDVTVTPHGIAAYVELSRQLVITSNVDIEAFARNELLRRVNLGVDKAGLVGSGTAGVPKGIHVLDAAAINEVTFGGAPTWAKITEFESLVEDDDGLEGSLAWITSALTKGAWKSTSKDSGSGQYLADAGARESNNTANGYSIYTTSQLKGTAFADRVVFGNWRQMIVAMFGGIEILPDQSAALHRKGLVGLTILAHVDVAVRQGKAFARSTDAGNQ